MTMSDLMWHKGRTMRVLHQDELTREEKDLLRADESVIQHGKLFLSEIVEEPEIEPTTAPEDEDDHGDEPTMDDLRSLKVAELQELADKEEVDLTGLKLKDDILGRMAAHFGLDPAS